eukprot:5630795-Pyramimonas_sp.AAC.1
MVSFLRDARSSTKFPAVARLTVHRRRQSFKARMRDRVWSSRYKNAPGDTESVYMRTSSVADLNLQRRETDSTSQNVS